MHQMQPPLAHRDIKPHNVLIRSHSPPEPAVPRQRFLEQQREPSSGGHAALRSSAPEEAQPLQSSPQADGSSGRYHAVLMVCRKPPFPGLLLSC